MKNRVLISGMLLPARLISQGQPAEPAMLIVERVEVRTVNKDQKPWDAGGGAPDLKVSVE